METALSRKGLKCDIASWEMGCFGLREIAAAGSKARTFFVKQPMSQDCLCVD